MASLESDALIDFYKRIRAVLSKASYSGELEHLKLYRQQMEGLVELATEPDGVSFTKRTVRGVACLAAEPRDGLADRYIICLHGGGYRGCSINSHRKMFGHLAKETRWTAILVDYSLAPEKQFPAAIKDVLDVYSDLLDKGVSSQNIAIAGDSAGGGLALSFQLRARELGLPLPSATMLISPWLDLEAKGATIATNKEVDKVIDPDPIPTIGRTYAGDVDLSDPLISPIHADYTGFAPIYIHVGTYEVLLDDSRRLHAAAKRVGVNVRLDEFPQMQHIFPIMVGKAPEATDSIQRFAKWLRAI